MNKNYETPTIERITDDVIIERINRKLARERKTVMASIKIKDSTDELEIKLYDGNVFEIYDKYRDITFYELIKDIDRTLNNLNNPINSYIKDLVETLKSTEKENKPLHGVFKTKIWDYLKKRRIDGSRKEYYSFPIKIKDTLKFDKVPLFPYIKEKTLEEITG